MTSEATIQRKIQTELTDADTRLWRNNVGALVDERGQHVTYGLCPGSSDLIGIRSVVVTADMVGTTVGLLVAIEVKRPGVTARPAHQVAFIDQILRMGGLAGFATSVDEALDVLAVGGYS